MELSEPLASQSRRLFKLNKNRLKMTCLAFCLALIAAALLSDNRAVRRVNAFAEGPNPGHTGAPGELTCATSGCHTGSFNSGPGQLSIVPPTSYQPGQTYQVTVMHQTSDSSRRRWGFQLTVLDDASNNKAGNLANLGSTTQVLDGGPDGTRQYIEHSFNGTFQGQQNGASWTFNWTAPSTDVGPVTFYAAGNEANNDGNNTGDQIYTTSVTIRPTIVTTGPPEIVSARISGKKLFIMGSNFGEGATLLMDGNKVKKVSNDEDNPSTILVAKKGGKSIDPGMTVMLQVKNPDDTVSNVLPFTRD
jgi:Reeler domain-containing protein